MVFNTGTIATAITPAVIGTFFSHYLHRKPRAQKPTAHISYDEGLSLIRKFLIHASHHTVEDIQRFTAQWVPHPTWVKVEEVMIPDEYVLRAAEAIQEQLGHHGIEKIGGKVWWQWRRPGSDLKAEWIEMRADYNERKKTGDSGKRVMLYVHGGAYFFARYRLAPQFPFPCGLLDCLAAYLYLLTVQDPNTIILAGDSAGGGMVLSMLVTLRDRGIPLPAGAVLISPWVDLTHSFPSVSGDNPLDYIPPHGFHQRPSASWPPPNSDDMLAIEEGLVKELAKKDHASFPQQSEADAVQGFHVEHNSDAGIKNGRVANGTATKDGPGPTGNIVPGSGHNLSIMIDGNLVELKDQIQMYASNQLISHPLVSPILQPSLGGLPPLLILTGGGEMLRDEQIYLAHKAANPTKYPPGDAFLDESPHDHNRNQVNRWKPTDVQLQVWEDLCHVAPTLSFTRPAKYMYRSIAQFGAWSLARAQHTEIDILDDDDVSVISTSDLDNDDELANYDGANGSKANLGTANRRLSLGQVGKAGDPLPPFKNHMIRQRIDRHGNVFPLEPVSELIGCNLDPSEIGIIKEGPVKKWMTAKQEWDTKFASAKRRIQKQRAKEMAIGYQSFGDGEVPPPSALAGRRKTGEDLREKKNKKSMGLSMWSGWGSKHDEYTIEREKVADAEPITSTATDADGEGARPLDDTKTKQGHQMEMGKKGPYTNRSRSRRSFVSDQNQADGIDEHTPAAELLAIRSAQTSKALINSDDQLANGLVNNENNPSILVRSPTNKETSNAVDTDGNQFDLKRPKAGGIAFPFTIRGHSQSASMSTLTSSVGVAPIDDHRTVGATQSGVTPLGKPGEVVVENGEVVSAERPALDTFVTAASYFPTVARSNRSSA